MWKTIKLLITSNYVISVMRPAEWKKITYITTILFDVNLCSVELATIAEIF